MQIQVAATDHRAYSRGDVIGVLPDSAQPGKRETHAEAPWLYWVNVPGEPVELDLARSRGNGDRREWHCDLDSFTASLRTTLSDTGACEITRAEYRLWFSAKSDGSSPPLSLSNDGNQRNRSGQQV